jgi:hypothetical protein
MMKTSFCLYSLLILLFSLGAQNMILIKNVDVMVIDGKGNTLIPGPADWARNTWHYGNSLPGKNGILPWKY